MPNDTPQPASAMDLASVFVAETAKLKNDLLLETARAKSLERQLAAETKARAEAEAARDAAVAAKKAHPTAERTFKALTERNDAQDECAKQRVRAEQAEANLRATQDHIEVIETHLSGDQERLASIHLRLLQRAERAEMEVEALKAKLAAVSP